MENYNNGVKTSPYTDNAPIISNVSDRPQPTQPLPKYLECVSSYLIYLKYLEIMNP